MAANARDVVHYIVNYVAGNQMNNYNVVQGLGDGGKFLPIIF
jgi:hypothetical protein